MSNPRPLRWLHLSDLHLGCPGRSRWWTVHDRFEHHLRGMVTELGAPDVVLLTGDLTYGATREQYNEVDALLDSLASWCGSAPIVIAVPGNHDVQPPRKVRTFHFLRELHRGRDDPAVAELLDELWTDHDASFIEPLFTEYSAWLERRVLVQGSERVRVTKSHFPGDLMIELDLPGVVPARFVGLNTAWCQYTGADDGDESYRGRLDVSLEQYHAALGVRAGENPHARLREDARATVLLMHHPPAWLSPIARRHYYEGIHNPEYITICLHGHLHEARTEYLSSAGGRPRHYFQAPSLFGLENYGHASEKRQTGYSLGELSADGELRVWPFRGIDKADGALGFDRDTAFYWGSRGVVIRESPRTRSSDRPPQKPEMQLDLDRFLKETRAEVDTIELKFVGRGRAAQQKIDELYTPLRANQGWEIGDPLGERTIVGPYSPKLSDLLPRYKRLLVEGEPGAGKTTFLYLVASMLARDRMDEPCPDGGTWRAKHLGLTDPRAALPVFVRLAALVDTLADKECTNRRCVLDHLAERTCPLACTPDPGARDPGFNDRRAAWDALLTRGDAWLLLDGLDEVAGEEARARVVRVFANICERWGACRIIVTSRPIDTDRLVDHGGFTRAVVDPFGEREIKIFVHRWVDALYEQDPKHRSGEALAYRDRLFAALRGHPEIRKLAQNPVMLTCLCVVHWNAGGLPDGRAAVYRAVLDWMLKARRELREQRGFPQRLAETAYSRLALAMMSRDGEKQSVVGLGWAATQVEPDIARHFPELARDAEARHEKARTWLERECEYSGVVQELSGRRIKFWHLTFQEYLAAAQLAQRPTVSLWEMVERRLFDSQWRETIEMLAPCVLERGQEETDALFELVLAMREDSSNLATEGRVVGIMGRLVEPLKKANGYVLQPELRAIYEDVRERVLGIFTPQGAVALSIADRIMAAEGLGQGGDPRIAKGTFEENLIEIPRSGILLGRYPVTVEEYSWFVEDRGYQQQQWWTPEGWAFCTQRGWNTPLRWVEQTEYPNRPVVCLSWYEACAYCMWLSNAFYERFRQIRLPTKEEWMKAASPDGRRFPWGDAEPSVERAKFGNSSSMRDLAPIGVYPGGRGLYGHDDLLGNVYEWCLDELPNVNVTAKQLATLGSRRLFVGGSYATLKLSELPAMALGWSGARGDIIGFRLVAVAV